MKMVSNLSRLAVLLLAAFGVGCASLSKPEVAALRAKGVPPPLVTKLERRGVLSPGEIIALHKSGVPSELVARHLDQVGIDYALDRDDLRKLETARVPDQVILAARRASSRYQRAVLTAPAYIIGEPWFYDPYHFTPRFGVGIGWGRRCWR
jgi:hypothetical protein